MIFHNYGESEENTPIDADFLNSLVQKTQHITGDNNGTHFVKGVYANGNELVADDDYKDPNYPVEETPTEEVSGT